MEINCHGGSLVTRRVLEAVLKTGARIAQPGEFTKRSFLNGRIDLTQAEAVIDLIESKTELSRQAAVNQLEGRLKTAVREMREEILDMIASIEAVIDYPDYDVEEEPTARWSRAQKSCLREWKSCLKAQTAAKSSARLTDCHCRQAECREILFAELAAGGGSCDCDRYPRHNAGYR